MNIIRPPFTGNPEIDSWTNQITQALNMGLLLPGVQGQSGGDGSSGTAGNTTLYLYQRTTTDSAPSRPASVAYDYTDIDNVTITADNSWLGEVPTSGGKYLWITFRYVSELVDTITQSNTWNTPVLLAVDGDDGVDGVDGVDGLTGASSNIIFIRSATQPPTPSASSGIPSGWYDTPPAGTEILWSSSGIKTVGATTFTWGSPFQIEGASVAEVFIYRKNSSTFTAGTSSYNFVTQTLTPPTDWSTTVPTLSSNGDVIYRVSGVTSGAATQTSAAITYGLPVVYAQRTDGTDGIDGDDGLTGASSNIIFIRSADAPSTPSASAGIPSGWYDTPPTGTNILWAASGTKVVGDTTFTWGTPFQIEGTSVAEVSVYRKNANTFSTGGSYNFVTQTLTAPTDWSTTVPTLSSDGDIIYRVSGVTSGAATQTAASVSYGSPVIYAQRTDGTNGGTGDTGPRRANGFIYRSTFSAGSAPTGGSIDWPTGVLTPPTGGWSNTAPSATSSGNSVFVSYWAASEADDRLSTTITYTVPVLAQVVVNDIKSVNFDGTVDNLIGPNSNSGTVGYAMDASTGTAVFSNVIVRGRVTNEAERFLSGFAGTWTTITASSNNIHLEPAFSEGAGPYRIFVVGAGGAGGRAAPAGSVYRTWAAGGGGAGGFAAFTLEWDGTTALDCTVGSGGESTGSANAYHAGNTGGATTFSIGGSVVVTCNGGTGGVHELSSTTISSGGSGGTATIATNALITDTANNVTNTGGSGGYGIARVYTMNNTSMACGGGGGVNFLSKSTTRGGNATIGATNLQVGAGHIAVAAGGGGGPFGDGINALISAVSDGGAVNGGDVAVGSGRGIFGTGAYGSYVSGNGSGGGAGEVAPGGSGVIGPYLGSLAQGFSIAIGQPHTGSTGGNSPPLGTRTAIMSGGGAFAKAGGQTEIPGFEYKAQDGEIFGGGGGAAYANSALDTTSGGVANAPRGGNGGFGAGGGAGGVSQITSSRGGDGIILIARL